MPIEKLVVDHALCGTTASLRLSQQWKQQFTLVELSLYKFTHFQAILQLMFTVTGQFDEVFYRKTIFLFQEDEC